MARAPSIRETFHGTDLRRSATAVAFAALTALSSCGGGSSGGGTAEPAATTTTFQQAVDPNLTASARQAEATYDYETAGTHYQALLQRHPGDRTYSIAYARNLRYSGKAEIAIAILSEWLSKNAPDAKVLMELGKSYLAADRLNLAEKMLRQSIEKDPNNWDAYSSLAVVQDYLGRHADAQALYRESLKISPDNPVVLNNLGLSRAQAGDLNGAIESLRKASDQPSAGPQVRQNLALMLALKGDLPGAERLTRKDLPTEVARKNMVYFRQLSGQE